MDCDEIETEATKTMGNKTADDMFDELGHVKDETGEEIIYQLNQHEIVFYLSRKQFDCGCGIGREFITMQELKAINKKCEELKWI